MTKSGTVLANTNKFAYRLANTTKTIGQLVRDDKAILLENALIDTRNPQNLSIPANLRASGDPGAYIVQARGAIDNAFRAMLAQAGAMIVSYIPNNAYLVRISQGGANGLAGNPLTQAVIPYEPYYKIQSSLLGKVLQDQPLPPAFNVAAFQNTAAETKTALVKAGWTIVSQQPSPFGEVFTVQGKGDVVALAQMSPVQIVESSYPRVTANDLSRATVGVAADTQVTTNYLGLTGKNVTVEVNDTGIDAKHPDFGTVGGLPVRVIGDAVQSLVDTNGHGTHVAGIIAGDGTESLTVTNAQGSIMPATNGQFRGMAPGARLYSVAAINDTFDFLTVSEQYMQQAPALTNALISNNSWNYGDNNYDLAAASYDAAVRDALPTVTGSQPVLFVFSAGNSGGGDNDGFGGVADTILSPATAKNVITVGALEQPRNITNVFTNLDGSIDMSWGNMTDSGDQVASYSSRGNVGIGVEGSSGRFKPDVVAPGTFVVSTRSEQWDEAAYYNPTNDHVSAFSDQLDPNARRLYNPLFIPLNTVQMSIEVLSNNLSPSPFPAPSIWLWQGTAPTGPPNPPTPITGSITIPPESTLAPLGVSWRYAISNNASETVSYDVILQVITTNDFGNYYTALSNLNQSIGKFNPGNINTEPGPYYRYESGTSMSAADVSGVLALMQEFFTNTFGITPSPALMKAALINGARSDGNYGFQVNNSINFQGWGLINLPNTLPVGITNQLDEACDYFFVDQSPTNALATGDSHTYFVTLDTTTDAQFLPLRITLAWTDPPGDPVAAIKLVNSLELVVTNLDDPTTPIIYYGNDIEAAGDIYNTQETTNTPPNFDVINNVQNVFIPSQFPSLLGTNYSITVIGRQVNVNAVTAQTNTYAVNGPPGTYAPNVVQDYALAVSCGEGEVPNAFTVTDNGIFSNPTGDQQITYVSGANNNGPLLNQFVGANTPLMGTNTIPIPLTNSLTTTFTTNELNGVTNEQITIGMTNQWHFYVVTNTFAHTNTAFTNAAFITFSPPTLSIPRMGVFADSQTNATRPEADIDIYVTTDPTLTNLNPTAINGAATNYFASINAGTNSTPGVSATAGGVFQMASLGRGGTEYVVDTNSQKDEVYYIGVKSEDQMASEYAFMSVFTATPFSQMNGGIQTVNGFVVPASITDGSPAIPGFAYVGGIALYPITVRRVVVTNEVWHQNFGDLFGTLTLNGGHLDVLNNHDSLGNTVGLLPFIYDDSGQGDIIGSLPSDGPGNLRGFIGQQGAGLWMLTESDNSLSQTGSVENFSLMIEPHRANNGTTIFEVTAPCGWYYDYIDVPPGATNFIITVTNLTTTGQGPESLYVKFGDIPTTNSYDEITNITPPATVGTISNGLPTAGRYFFGVYVPCTDGASQSNSITVKIGYGAVSQVDYTSSGPVPILDDAVTTNSIFVPVANAIISSVDVGLAVEHPRISDLVFHLISPDGTRILLMENRGGTDTNGAGATLVANSSPPVTNYSYLVFTENTNLTTTPIKFAPPPFVSGVAATNTLVSAAGFEGLTAANFSAGQTVDGWTVLENQVSLVTDPANACQGSNFLALANGTISRTLPTVAGQTYTLTFAYRGPGIVGMWRGEGNGNDSIAGNNGTLHGVGFTSGVVGQAFAFDESLVAISDRPAYVLTNSLSIEGWVRPRGNGNIFFRGDNRPGYDPYNLGMTSGALGFSIWDDAGDHPDISAPLVASQWSHVAATLDGNSGAMTLYVNGNPVSQIITAIRPLGVLTAGHPGVGIGDINDGNFSNPFHGDVDEISLYSRALSASEVGAIYNDSVAGKFDAAVSFPQNLAEAALVIIGGMPAHSVIYGTNASWQTQTITFTATQNGTPLQIYAKEPGLLLDSFVLSQTQQGGGLYYLPEQPMDSLAGQNAYGTWTLEIQDDRAGATNLATLGSWQLRFIFANAVPTASPMLGTLGNTNIYETNTFGLLPYTLIVTNTAMDADMSRTLTYFLLAPAGAAIDTNGIITWTPSEAQGPGTYLFTTVVSDNSAPPLSAMNDFTVTVNEVNERPVFLFPTNTTVLIAPQSAPFTTACIATDADIPINPLTFALVSGPTGLTVSADGVISWHPQPADAGANGVTISVTDTNQWALHNPNSFSVTNSFAIIVVPPPMPFTNGVPVTNTIPSGGIVYYSVPVPTNADFATNILLSATAQVNVWFNQNYLPAGTNPPDSLLITNATVGTNVLSMSTMPPLMPGQTYYIGVQNTGGSPVSAAFEVDFHLIPPPMPLTNGVPVTNSIPSGGIVYYSVSVPTSADYATNRLLSATGRVNMWFNQNYLPCSMDLLDDCLLITNATVGTDVLNTGSTPPLMPGQTYYIGVQNTNGFAVTNAFEVDFHFIPSLTNGVPVTNSIPSGGIVYYSISVPINADFATNILWSATASVNVWFNQTNLPCSTDLPDDVPLIENATAGTDVLVWGGGPSLIPGQTYYIGVQNTSGSDVTAAFEVDFHLLPIIPLTNRVPVTNSIGNHRGGFTHSNHVYYSVTVPTNVSYATNILVSAIHPVNVWFNQNALPSPGVEYPIIPRLRPYGAVNLGADVLSAGSIPPLMPGQTYYIDVENGSSGYADTVVFEVIFDQPVVNSITSGLPQTNTIAPGDIAYYSISVPQWVNYATNRLLSADAPLNVWFNQNTPPSGTNPPDSLFITNAPSGTNVLSALTMPPLLPGQTYYIGVQNANGFAVTHAFEVDFDGPVVTSLANSQLQTNTIAPGGFVYYSVSVPINATFADNYLDPATTGRVNVWFNQNNLPSGTHPPDYLLITNAFHGDGELWGASTPPLVLGTYYIGVQNTNGFAVTTVFDVVFYLPPLAISSPAATGIGAKLQWFASPDAQFQVEWATNISPPIVWMTNAETITSTDGMFTFTDPGSTNSHARFYRLIQLP
jgi:subtilisin-like proprotein convertase family protein